jgi:hypothetical protein
MNEKAQKIIASVTPIYVFNLVLNALSFILLYLGRGEFNFNISNYRKDFQKNY